MEPIHLSSAIAAKKIISEELPQKEVRISPYPESLLETPEQLMVEDLYNRVKDMMDDRSPYNTPCVLDIQRALVKDHLESPFNPVDEVWPNIFIGEKSVAVNKARLKRMGITHILNAAHGTGVYTGQAFYSGMNITYMGIEVDDFSEADISPHFRTTAEFLDEALLTHKGKVLVDSMMGVSRSAILVAAYLMIFHEMTIVEALTEIRKKRAINPNEGFIKQLRQLNENLLEERDDDDTLSQCSVIDTHAQVQEEEESVMGVKAHSIMMEEEEDAASVMSSVASSAAAAAVKAGLLGGRSETGAASSADNVELPGKGAEDEEDDDVDSMVREWQRRNERYQSEDWWEAQLMCEDDGESLPGENGRKFIPKPDDLESVTSEEVRAMKETLEKRCRRRTCDTASTTSCSSYSDLWKERLREIEEQAASRYKAREEEESKHSSKKIDEDLESLMSDSSSIYNFCKKNKETLSPLERWRVKRVHYGWNKNRDDGDTGSVLSGAGSSKGDAEEPVPNLEDVNLTAYQTWKLKQQKKYGGDEDKDELLEMSRVADSNTAKRRQRREELLERTRKTLEESQSVCGWDAASGNSIPLSAFCAGAFPAQSVANDDNMSMLSGRSSVRSSQASSLHSQPPVLPMQLPPMPALQTPDGEPMVNIAAIQNWISNVVVETLMQKQGDMVEGSALSVDLGRSTGRGSVLGSVRGVDDDKVSMLSGTSYSSVRSRNRPESVLSAGGLSKSSSDFAEYGKASRKNKITTTSVPLYSLFADTVNLSKLDSMDKDIKAEMSSKIATYEKKKIAEDNKRSTLFKKKKAKEESEEDESEEFEAAFKTPASTTNKYSSSTMTNSSERPKIKRDYGLSGRLNLSGIEKEKACSIDEWLKNVRPPAKRAEPVGEEDTTVPEHMDGAFARPSALTDTSRRKFTDLSDDDDYGDGDDVMSSMSRYSPNAGYSNFGRSESPPPRYQARSYTARAGHTLNLQSDTEETERRSRNRNVEDEDDEDVNAYLSQIRQRCRERAQRELEENDDEVLAAWRKQEEAKSASHS